MFRRSVKRTRDGRYVLHLSAFERDLLRSLPEQMNELLARDDPSLVRLFPPAYTDDPEKDAEFRRLMREDLVDRRRQGLAVFERTVDATELTEDELGAWLRAVNDVRLVLGTQLGVSEDADPPITPEYQVYHYLSVLAEQMVEALAGW